MKGKNAARLFIACLFSLFLCLYVTQALGYYEFTNYKKTTLTNKAIERFEEDVKSGKKIDAKDYVEAEKNYNNLLSRTSLTISNTIEKTFDMLMNCLFNELSKVTS